MQQDKQEQPRITLYHPMRVLAGEQSGVTGKMIELSAAGARFLCALAPAIHAELEIVFSLPFKQSSKEFKLQVRVLHAASVAAKPATQSNGLHAVDVEFINTHEHERGLLEEYVMSVRTG